MNFIVIIPSRYGSTRFPGKPLADIAGKKMVQRVYEQAAQTNAEVWVATDDQRIIDAVNGFGGNAIMTAANHQSGTDRCAEAITNIIAKTGKHYDVVINVQGDEPFIHPDQIELIMSRFVEKPETELATLIQKITKIEDVLNTANAKVVLDADGNALFFSRAPIPYVFKHSSTEWLSVATFYNHVGLYAYRTSVLQKLTKLNEGKLEKAESLEQLRWLENGFKISTCITNRESFSIDTPSDIEKVLKAGRLI